MIEMQEQATQEQQHREMPLVIGEKIGCDWRQHVEDSIRSKHFEWFSCYGCGLRVRHEGYCHKCG